MNASAIADSDGKIFSDTVAALSGRALYSSVSAPSARASGESAVHQSDTASVAGSSVSRCAQAHSETHITSAVRAISIFFIASTEKYLFIPYSISHRLIYCKRRAAVVLSWKKEDDA